MSAASTTQDPKARLAELRRNKAKRAEADAEAREAAELQGLELEERFERELGRQGVDFAIVDATALGEGYVVVKPVQDLSFRKYLDAVASSPMPSPADLADFVRDGVVFPDLPTYDAMVMRRGFIANRAADAMCEMHGLRAKVREGK